MIVLRAVRVEDSGVETELGEVRLTEVGAVFAHSSTPEGQGVVADIVERMRCATSEAMRQSRSAAAPFRRQTRQEASVAGLRLGYTCDAMCSPRRPCRAQAHAWERSR